MHPRVAYVTHAGSVAPDPDIDAALSAISATGLDAEARAWDSDTAWDTFDLVLVRSAWDHAPRRQEFLRWARWVEDHTQLANPAVTLARNTDRTYLRDLRKQGFPVVDTVWLEPGEDQGLCEAQIVARGWERCAVRPHIGTGSAGVEIVDGAGPAAQAAGSLAARGAVAMVQPAPWFEDPGAHVSVVLLDGRISHAVAIPADHPPAGDPSAVETVAVDTTIADLANAVFDTASGGEKLLYARVDLINDEGDWQLWGFEATDPCLFLGADTTSAATLGRAVRGWIMPEAKAADFLVGSG